MPAKKTARGTAPKRRRRSGGAESFFRELLDYFLAAIRQYFVVKGRASRREFWMFVLAGIIIGFMLGILAIIPILGIIAGIAGFLFSIGTIIPGITAGVRRLHDTNKTGWLMLLLIIPLIGLIIILVWCAKKGNSGRNRYGPKPGL
jgi:uncharacterized membrane protein YhaH (DUF805 family)